MNDHRRVSIHSMTWCCLLSALLIIYLPLHATSYHAYDMVKLQNMNNSGCPSFDEATRPYTDEFVQKLKLWPGMMNDFDKREGETLYGSQAALDMIHNNQHPVDCSQAAYLVSGGWPYGFGSRIHMEGLLLGMALHLGMVYLPHPSGDNFFWETDIPFCKNKDRYEPGMNCFYERYSSCTMKDALLKTGMKSVDELPTLFMGDFAESFQDASKRNQLRKSLKARSAAYVVILTFGGSAYKPTDYIPAQVSHLISCSPIRDDIKHYWWRAVSAAYITRPNELTLELLKRYQTLDIEDFRELVTMFVRHGDKGKEMKLLNFESYASTTQLMWDSGLVPTSHHYIETHRSEVQSQSGQQRRLRSVSNVVGSRNTTAAAVTVTATATVVRAVRATTSATMSTAVTASTAAAETAVTASTAAVETAVTAASSASTSTASAGLQQTRKLYDGRSNKPEKNFDPTKGKIDDLDDLRYVIPFNGSMFVTTEDPDVIAEAKQFGRDYGWKIFYTNLFNRAAQTALKTWDEQHQKGTVAVHDDLEYISMLLNLYYSTRGESWVCTIQSNSCRLMDELRATIGAKANRNYADLSIETCPEPPCLAMNEIERFGG